MDATESYKISLFFKDIKTPLVYPVKNSEEERILREAADMINSSYSKYKDKIAGMDNASYFVMVAILLARKLIKTTEEKISIEKELESLEKEIATYLKNNNL